MKISLKTKLAAALQDWRVAQTMLTTSVEHQSMLDTSLQVSLTVCAMVFFRFMPNGCVLVAGAMLRAQM